MIDRANALLITLVFGVSDRARARLGRQEGQAFVEYAMVLLLVTVALAAGTFITPFRNAISSAFTAIGNAITDNIPS
jgi:Flp pilus assembly pilin Flp